jgi:hypothetical protein
MHLTFVKFDSAFTLNKIITYKNLIRWTILKKQRLLNIHKKKDGSLHVLLN